MEYLLWIYFTSIAEKQFYILTATLMQWSLTHTHTHTKGVAPRRGDWQGPWPLGRGRLPPPSVNFPNTSNFIREPEWVWYCVCSQRRKTEKTQNFQVSSIKPQHFWLWGPKIFATTSFWRLVVVVGASGYFHQCSQRCKIIAILIWILRCSLP